MPERSGSYVRKAAPFEGGLEQAMGKLVERAARILQQAISGTEDEPGRLIQLDESHYFDTVDKVLLLKDGAQYKNFICSPVYLRRSSERIREDARKKGYAPVAGGAFWDPRTKHLYIINGERYVLYALDRRTRSRQRRATDEDA